ncbi:MAG: oligosaccharide flippase family protein [Gammaproteobacteria bacterium]|nr:oligosaccharide flippase family protein [Gammaproteobacteria bacterium]
MKKYIKNMHVSSALIYAGASAVMAMIPLLLLPIFTSFVSTSQYGIYVTFVLVSKIGCSLISLGYIECLAREFTSASKDEFAKIYTNAVFVVSIWSVFISSCILIVNTLDFYFLKYLSSVSPFYIFSACLIAFSQFVINSLLSIFQMSSKPYFFSTIKVSLLIIEYFIVFTLIFLKDITDVDLIGSYLAAHLLILCASLFYLVRNNYILKSHSVRLFDPNLRTSLPLVPHEIGGLILSFSDRFMINYYIGSSAVAVYAISYQFGQIVSLVDAAVNKAWIPWLYKELQKEIVLKSKIVKVCCLYLCFLLLFAVSVSNVGAFIVNNFYNSEYKSSSSLIFYVAMAFVVFGVYKIFAGFLFFYKKTIFLGFSTIVSVISSVLLGAYLIPEYGINGAAYSTLISFSILCVMVMSYLFYLRRVRANLHLNK